ncbi:MAG: aspartate-semialdehyde dehydrogenase, partial [Bacteroidota bacterium]
MKVAVIGASGLVGQKMLQLLDERNFPLKELIPVASERSVGKSISFKGKEFIIQSMEDAIAAKPDIALFSAGGSVSLEYAPKFAEVGSVVIDNSSAWRMDASKKLIVPEVNGNILRIDDRIIANPNCSTIQMVVALKPLHDAFKIKRIVVSTYQSVTGSGKGAVDQLEGERQGKDTPFVYLF